MKQKKSGNGEFKKEIGLFGGMSVICGIMIGSGIFYLGSYVLQRSNYSLGLALICWLLGGLVSLLGGLCFAELGASDPKAGGQLVYLSKAYHPVLGFMYPVDPGQLRLHRSHRGGHPDSSRGLYPGAYPASH